MDSSSTMELTSERILVAAMIGVLALIGVLSNLFATLVMLRLRVFRTSFGVLSVCDTLSNAGVLLTFLLWAFPVTLTSFPPWLEGLNRSIGQLALFFQTVSLHAVLCVSINRFFAISCPGFYRKRFDVKNTLIVAGIIVVVSMAYASVYFHEDCYFRYEPREFYWEFSATACGSAMAYYVDLSYSVGLMAVALGFELITLVKLKIMQNSTASTTSSNRRKHKQDIIFFIQTCSISNLFAFMFFCFHMISPSAETRFEVFMTTTFIWGFAHGGSGLMYIIFNRQIRQRLLNPRDLLKSETPQLFTTVNVISTAPNTRSKFQNYNGMKVAS